MLSGEKHTEKYLRTSKGSTSHLMPYILRVLLCSASIFIDMSSCVENKLNTYSFLSLCYLGKSHTCFGGWWHYRHKKSLHAAHRFWGSCAHKHCNCINKWMQLLRLYQLQTPFINSFNVHLMPLFPHIIISTMDWLHWSGICSYRKCVSTSCTQRKGPTHRTRVDNVDLSRYLCKQKRMLMCLKISVIVIPKYLHGKLLICENPSEHEMLSEQCSVICDTNWKLPPLALVSLWKMYAIWS